MTLPPPLSWFYDAWMEFSKTLGMIMNRVILTILWIVGFGIYAIVLKLLRLFIRKAEVTGTCWIDVKPVPPDDLHHQF